jgi:Domain of unknown function (DUF4440)
MESQSKPILHSSTVATAQRFATALDEENYAPLAELLAADCEYVTSQTTLVGREAIVLSYKDAGTWAKANIQSVRYQSSVRDGDDNQAVITFIDHFAHKGREHTYRCEQVIQVNAEGSVRRIVHRELPGEREAADAFLRAGEVSRGDVFR